MLHLLLACAASDGPVDVDGDGYTEDCADGDASIHPGATEICDGIDQDCDGVVDEDAPDAPSWYADNDGDAYGAGDPFTWCDPPAGFVASDEDCDDTDAAFHPGAEEPDCTDPTDYNCDGSTAYADADADGFAACEDCDDSDADVSEELIWYADADGDGYGDPDIATAGCEPPYGYVGDTDCDDADAEVHAGAVEICGNGVDDDCDGGSNPCGVDDSSLSAADAEFWGETDGDYAGHSVGGGGDVDSDGFDDLVVGSPGNDDGGADAGSAYLMLGSSVLSPTSLSTANAEYSGEADEDDAGYSVAVVGDVDADGFDDLLLGAYHHDDAGDDAGAAYIVLGSSEPASMALSSADAEYGGTAAEEFAGIAVAGAGDVDADGFADVLVGAKGNDAGGTDAGTAYLVLGSSAASSMSLVSAAAALQGEAEANYAGSAVGGAGDIDADGFDDFLVGAYGNDAAGARAGAVYLILGSSAPSSMTLSAADGTFLGEAEYDFAGNSVDGAGDVNADGHDDILIGAYSADETTGAAYMVLGSGTPSSMSLSSADAKLSGDGGYDFAGDSVSSAGDLDADGYADVLVGASGSDEFAGAVFVVRGSSAPASISLADADARLSGEVGGKVYDDYVVGDYAGSSASAAGDVDADGYADILVGAPGTDDAGTDAGSAYLILGGGL